MADRTPGQTLSGWQRAIVVLTLVAAGFGVFIRFTGVGDVFCQSPDEFSASSSGTSR